jgi:protoheme IX farnesyltransferase
MTSICNVIPIIDYNIIFEFKEELLEMRILTVDRKYKIWFKSIDELDVWRSVRNQIIMLYLINPKTAMFGAISIFLYTSLYTPLKTQTPLSVFVGAIPGAIPFMLGWVAATNHFGIEAGTLFLIQFFWQFPHFWAIGWFLFEDYEKAGFFMLPTGKKDTKTATQIILYTLWLILTSLIPYFGYTGKLQISLPSAILIFAIGLWMLLYAVKLYHTRTPKAARALMLVSVSYITLLQIIYITDKFLR